MHDAIVGIPEPFDDCSPDSPRGSGHQGNGSLAHPMNCKRHPLPVTVPRTPACDLRNVEGYDRRSHSTCRLEGAKHNMPSVALTDEFWAACRDRVLVRPVCGDCGTNFFTPQWCCPTCHSESWTYVPSNGLGTVYSFTVVHRAPTEDFATPYVLAVVQMDEGWNLMTRIVGDRDGNADDGGADVTTTDYIGRRVEVAFTVDPRDESRLLPTFTLRREP